MIRAAHAARPKVPLAVLTFEPHPREHFRPDDPPFRLTLSAERAEALEALGVTLLYELRFDHEFSLMPAEAFVSEVLHQGLGARHLVCGPDFAFGRRRGGGTDFLAEHAEAMGMGLTLVPLLTDGGGPISATRIRRVLQDGYPERATADLGRPWAVRGVVAHGDARGRTIGFPTANIALGRHLEPARGVYAVTVRLPDGRLAAGRRQYRAASDGERRTGEPAGGQHLRLRRRPVRRGARGGATCVYPRGAAVPWPGCAEGADRGGRRRGQAAAGGLGQASWSLVVATTATTRGGHHG